MAKATYSCGCVRCSKHPESTVTMNEYVTRLKNHSCSTDPAVRELREAAKESLDCGVWEGTTYNSGDPDDKAEQRLRTALEAIGEK